MGLSLHREVFQKDATSKTILVYLQDDSDNDGTGKTGLLFSTASLTAYYARPLAAAVAITLATQTVTGAWSSGGFVEIDATNMPGLYRLDLPNAVLATGVDRVYVVIKGATDMNPAVIAIDLVSYNPDDVDLGMDAAIADAVWDEALSGHTTAGSAGENQNLIDNMPQTAAAIATAVETSLIPIAGTAQAGGASTIQLETGESAVDDAYNNYIVILVGGTGSGQARFIEDYVGATRTATVTGTWTTNPASGTKYILVRT